MALSDFSPLEGARLISGNPLTGQIATPDDFLGTDHFVISALPQSAKRPLLYFLRPGFGRYSFHRAYPLGHLSHPRPQNLSVRLHGEERPFIDGHVYDKVMPLRIPTMPLVKAVMAEEWEKAQEYGLLEVVPDDFVLPTFICPSKIEMVEVMSRGINTYVAELSE